LRVRKTIITRKNAMTFATINALKEELEMISERRETIERLLCLYSPLPTTPQGHPACGADPESKVPLRAPAQGRNGRPIPAS
jgi:hypothetical protein